jgi:hypothetical protein
MTATRTVKTRASSTPALLSVSTLLLAAAIALEVSGLHALDQADAAASVVASIDGAAIDGPATAVRRLRAASVEVHVIAQADLPAR